MYFYGFPKIGEKTKKGENLELTMHSINGMMPLGRRIRG